MKGLTSVRVRNLRSFGPENEFIPLKKINIFVGKNSCGKSTLLRTFPLIRQSVEADTRNPILWYGSIVDFGDLKTATNSQSKEVSFDFNIEAAIQEGPDRIDQLFHDITKPSSKVNNFQILTTLSLSQQTEDNYITNLRLTIGVVEVEISYSEKQTAKIKIFSNGEEIYDNRGNATIARKGNLIPTDFVKTVSGKVSEEYWGEGRFRTSPRSELTNYIYSLHPGNKNNKNLNAYIEKIPLTPRSKIEKLLKRDFARAKILLDPTGDISSGIIDKIYGYIVGSHLHKILESIDSVLSGFYSGVRYLGPVRASTERYYRYQDLQVAQVDHTGANLPMVLNSLSVRDREALNKWIKEHFEFELMLKTTVSHYAVLIKETGSTEYHNISDMGFGYSQILPIIVSIWLENISRKDEFRRRRISKYLIIAIEQPELHLHPHLQHMFGKAISKIAKLQDDSIFSFVLETHSKHIIDAIGESIEEEILDSEDVNITTFEKNGDGFTRTHLSAFDKDGYLMDWPAGFLSP